MKVAIVHDWLTSLGGAEKVLASIIRLFPQADLYCLFDFFPDEHRSLLSGKKPRTSFLQRMPFVRRNYRHFLPLMPFAIEQFDLAEYDLIISSSHAVAKNVLTHTDQVHICYCHSPMRYAWDLYHSYMRLSGAGRGMKGLFARMVLHYMRIWDGLASSRVDHFIANSRHVAQRIKKHYGKDATVIYPPVNIDFFEPNGSRSDYYITVSRMVPYKRVDLIISAFNQMPEKRLLVIGDGPGLKKIRKIANQNIELLGFQPDSALRDYMQKARAFIFAAQEDFGILPVEAQACGIPVLAYASGGILETVVENSTGMFFDEQTTDGIIGAVQAFERANGRFDPDIIRKNAEQFSRKKFEEEMMAFIEQRTREHFPCVSPVG